MPTNPLRLVLAAGLFTGFALAAASQSPELRTLADVGQRSIALSGRGAQGLDVDLETGLVYVANNGNAVAHCTVGAGVEGALSVVDPALGRETARVDGVRGAVWPLVDAARDVVYSANSGGQSLTIHARGSGALLDTILLGGRPHQAGLDPESPLLVISNTNDLSQTWVALVDADRRTVVGHALVAPLPHGVAVDRARHLAYVSSVGDGTNTIVDLQTGAIRAALVTTTATDPNSNLNTFSQLLGRLYVANSREGVVVLDAESQARVGTVSFGTPAWGMQVDEVSGLLYAALPGQDAVAVADARTLGPLALVPVDGCPFAVRLDTVRRLGYSTSMSESKLSVFDLARVEAALGRSR